MKNKIVLMLIAGIFSFSANAQKIKSADVPAAVQHSFTSKYPGVKASWEKEKDNYEVSFKKDGKSMSQVIDKHGTVLETETEITVAELPAAARTYLQQHYKDAKIKEAARIEKAGSILYEAEVNGKDIMFDSNGVFIEGVKK